MNIKIEDKGNSVFKLTVTSNNEVRIKLQRNTSESIQHFYIDALSNIAKQIIDNKKNVVTLRGKCKEGDNSIKMYTDNKKSVPFTYILNC